MLGIKISQATVAKYMLHHRKPPSPTVNLRSGSLLDSIDIIRNFGKTGAYEKQIEFAK